MSTPTAKETADGLRALAEFCEQHPDLGARIGWALRCFPTPVHPRTMDELAAALDVLGEDVTVERLGVNTLIQRSWGPVSVKVVFDPTELTPVELVATKRWQRDGHTVIRETTERAVLPILERLEATS